MSKRSYAAVSPADHSLTPLTSKRRRSNFYVSSDFASRDEDKENFIPSSDTPVQPLSCSKRTHFEKILKESQNYGALSIADLPHPSHMYGKRGPRGRSKDRTFRKKYSIVENYTQQLKRKQSEFNWLQEETCRLENNSIDFSLMKQQYQHIDQLVPADSTYRLRNSVLQERSFNQVVPRTEEIHSQSSRIASKSLISSQQVNRSEIDEIEPIDTAAEKTSSQQVYAGYRLMSKLQLRCSEDPHSQVTSPYEANRFLTTGEITRPVADDAENQVQLHESTKRCPSFDLEFDNGFNFYSRNQKPNNENLKEIETAKDIVELPPDLEHLDNIIEWLDHGKAVISQRDIEE